MTQHKHTHYVKIILFWMRLIVIIHLSALIYIYICNKPIFTIKIVKSGLNEGFNDSLMNVCFISG